MTTSFQSWSFSQRKMPTMMQATSTTTVPWITWFWLGHSTFLSSAEDSWMKRDEAAERAAARRRDLDLAGWARLAGRCRAEIGFARHG